MSNEIENIDQCEYIDIGGLEKELQERAKLRTADHIAEKNLMIADHKADIESLKESFAASLQSANSEQINHLRSKYDDRVDEKNKIHLSELNSLVVNQRDAMDEVFAEIDNLYTFNSRVSIPMTDTMKNNFQKIAYIERTTMSDITRNLINDYVKDAFNKHTGASK